MFGSYMRAVCPEYQSFCEIKSRSSGRNCHCNKVLFKHEMKSMRLNIDYSNSQLSNSCWNKPKTFPVKLINHRFMII